MKQIKLSRRETMQTLLITGGSLLTLSQINIWKQPKRALAPAKDVESMSINDKLALTTPEQDVFKSIKKNLSYSNTVKDEQIAEFAKRIVDTSPYFLNYAATDSLLAYQDNPIVQVTLNIK